MKIISRNVKRAELSRTVVNRSEKILQTHERKGEMAPCRQVYGDLVET